uniref:Uncharacterized protein n=1 Tax=Solanum lycopersicum TaxID=4081 RepID=A0A3Q7GTF3_SOLLC
MVFEYASPCSPVVDANLTYYMDLSGFWSRKKSILLFSHSYKGTLCNLGSVEQVCHTVLGDMHLPCDKIGANLQKSKANVNLALPNFHC